MAHSKVKGYQVALTIGTDSIVGTTSDTFAGGGVIKEAIQKSDQGQTQYLNAGYEGTHSVNAFVYTGSEGANELGLASVLAACRDNTTGTYALALGSESGDPLITGTCTYLSCTVNSNSEDYADCSVELQITAAPTVTTFR